MAFEHESNTQVDKLQSQVEVGKSRYDGLLDGNKSLQQEIKKLQEDHQALETRSAMLVSASANSQKPERSESSKLGISWYKRLWRGLKSKLSKDTSISVPTVNSKLAAGSSFADQNLEVAVSKSSKISDMSETNSTQWTRHS